MIATTNTSVASLRQPQFSAPVVPNDVTDISATATKGLVVGGAGSLVGRLVGDALDRTWQVVAGEYVPGSFKLVKATGTTATAIISYSGG